jgi:hypothetical protein
LPPDSVLSRKFTSLQEDISRSQRERLSAAAHATETAGTLTPGSDQTEALALDVRKMAVAVIETDTQDLKSTLDSFGREVRRTKGTSAVATRTAIAGSPVASTM